MNDVAGGVYDALEPAWQEALRWADLITPSGAHPDEGAFQRLAGCWSSAQIVEITAVISLFNLFNRFANALHIPPTR